MKMNFFYLLKMKVLSFMLGTFALVMVIISFHMQASIEPAPRQLIAPPPLLPHMSVGYKEVIADTMWIRTIQDFDFCDQEIAKNKCKNNSWLYKMLDSITDLSPSFRMPYAVGGLALTVIISDIDGATKFFEKAVAAFPTDWPILYRAAYHNLYEVKDKKRAAELLVEAGKNGAPAWVYALAGRLYSDSGYLELAETLLVQMIEQNQDPKVIERLRDKIAKIKSESKTNKASQ
jgi:tetratricopeptide (TPR) repeat protein